MQRYHASICCSFFSPSQIGSRKCVGRNNWLKLIKLCKRIDFSENNVLKTETGCEVQSAHFGANDQVIVHQGVSYSKGQDPESFATISSDKRKTAESVIAHIRKAIEMVRTGPLNKISILSDGPSSQYRNCFTIYIQAYHAIRRATCFFIQMVFQRKRSWEE